MKILMAIVIFAMGLQYAALGRVVEVALELRDRLEWLELCVMSKTTKG